MTVPQTGVPMSVVIRAPSADAATAYPLTISSSGAALVYGSITTSAAISPTTAITNRSSTLTTGSTSQQVMAANASRRYLVVQNPITATETLFVAAGYTATTVSGACVELAPGGTWFEKGDATNGTAINVNAVTTAHAFTAWEG